MLYWAILINVACLFIVTDSQCMNLKTIESHSCQICFDELQTLNTCTPTEPFQHVNLSEAQCIQNCCFEQSQATSYPKFIFQIFKSCAVIKQEQFKKQEQNKIQLTVYLMTGGSLLCLGSCITIFIFKKICRHSTYRDRKVFIMSYNRNVRKGVLEECSFSSMQEHPTSDIKFSQEICCICLEGNTNAITVCMHYFHAACLQEWLYKKNKCPMCSSQKANCVKIFCTDCHCQIKLSNSNDKYFSDKTFLRCQRCTQSLKEKQ